jgi:hypothetical protein
VEKKVASCYFSLSRTQRSGAEIKNICMKNLQRERDALTSSRLEHHLVRGAFYLMKSRRDEAKRGKYKIGEKN